MSARARTPRARDWTSRAAALAVAAGLALSFAAAWRTGNRPWFDSRLRIDGRVYAEDMRDIAARGDFLRLNDLFHSPGYQLYLGALLTVVPEPATFRAVKLLAWGMAALCAAMIFLLGERRFGARVGAVAAVLLAFSAPWRAYIDLLQYEIPLAFLLTSLAFLFAADPLRGERPLARALLAGLVLAAACFIHFRLLILVPLGAASLWPLAPEGKSRARLAALLLFLAPPLLSTGAWSAYQSRRLGEAVVVQKIAPWVEQFRMHNNEQARGNAYPYIGSAEPAGAAFIAREPGRYLWLVMDRFLYLWDLKKDEWYVGPPPGAAEELFHLAACLLFLAGAALKLREDAADRTFRRTSILYAILLVALLGPILATGSSRFLIPVLPLVCLFQGHALVRARERFAPRA